VTQPSWQQAVSFAARQHAGQYRKDGATPYVAHPVRVALTVRHLFGVDDPIALCVALLHDVIEDTTADFDDVLAEFGPEVAAAVACLTKDKRLPDAEREPAFYARIAAGPWQARLVKLADAYDNLCDSASALKPTKAIDKARAALDAAGDDPRLRGAVELLQSLIPETDR
jgi:guanosine-3',5'-bis(diphosphate) 3'-pyrophosphohydrolase